MRELKKLFVVGGGFMGAGIAQTAISAGYEVVLNDLSMEILEKSAAGINSMLQKNVDKGRMSAEEKEAAFARLSLNADVEGAKDADIVIEAAVENVEIKKNVFARLSDICSEDAILASNTSSISIAELSSVVKNPERMLGMHFFSPVPLMKLLELVQSITTSEETIACARDFGEKLGKTCIVSKDKPAFIVNRMLDPMMNEAICLLESGTGSIEDIDTGAKCGLNHPMGPFELLDMAGIDIELAVMEVLYKETGDPKYRPSGLLRDMVRMGWLGRKSGIGFYVYNEDGTRTPNPHLG